MTDASGDVRVSVLIPVYNSASTLERCLRSAAEQTLADIEMLVADDGSTDDGADIAERFAAADPRVRVFRIRPNGGKSAAMNLMAAHARGEWIAVLDADDAYHEARLERLLAAAEAHGADMAADNIVYVDAGADQAVRTAFDPAEGLRVVGMADLIRNSDPHAAFDFGILKPVIRRSFVAEHGLTYHPTRLSEDFYYLMDFFLAGGRGVITGDASYFWTMPFGAISRAWTTTGSGAWRYDYRDALAANAHFLAVLRERGEADAVAMLETRSRQYRVMIHYLDAQRAASEGAWARCLLTIAAHPSTYPLLLRRIAGRMSARLRPDAPRRARASIPHPSLRGALPREQSAQ